eukprot:TRINITY_DN5070_c4_g1_i1.p1 TRINITY_DN5070_c4_g1~~TRINITY_DN5070_c4_g1_i1.p1  ORF type:complete len:1035 (+),score=243.79 TRINITY_DN5070_c4_g1_i1:77-3181(+)
MADGQPPIIAEGPPQQLEVTIFGAVGLQHLNFTGDAPYCVCEVLHADGHHQRTQVQTQPIQGTLEPQWNETFRLDPWRAGEPLEFGIFDKGLMGSKAEGTKIILDSEQFYPDGCEGELPIPGLEDARLHIRIVPAGPSETEAAWAHEEQGPIVAEGPPQKLEVAIIQATGLRHLNMTGDAPYVVCEVDHADRHQKKASCQTQAIKGTLDPQWNEVHEVDPWRVGESLTFTVYDKGTIGSKTEGKITVPSRYFYPQGFEGEVPIEGLEHSMLYVRIVPAGASDVLDANGQPFPAQQQQHQQQPTAVPTQPAAAPLPTQQAVPYPQGAAVPGTTYIADGVPGTTHMAQPAVPADATLLQGDHPSGTLSLQTVDNAQELSKKGFGPGKYIGINIGAANQELLPVEKLGSLQLATPTMHAHASGEPITLAKDAKTAKPGDLQEPPPQRLQISLLGATGLKHMNMTGDNMWCDCKTKPLKPHGKVQTIATKTLSKTLEPNWNETHIIDPWHEGEQLEFTVYDKGIMGSKKEGKAILHPEQFYPHGCEGQLPLEGLEEAGLSVRVVPLGPSTGESTAQPVGHEVNAGPTVYPAQPASVYPEPASYSTGPTVYPATVIQQGAQADVFSKLDTNHDGVLSREEFAQMTSVNAQSLISPGAGAVTNVAPLAATYMAPTYTVPGQSLPAAAPMPALQSTYGPPPAVGYVAAPFKTPAPVSHTYTVPAAAPAVTYSAPPALTTTYGTPFSIPAAEAALASPVQHAAPATYAMPAQSVHQQPSQPGVSATAQSYPPLTTTYGMPGAAPTYAAPAAQAPAAMAPRYAPQAAAPAFGNQAGAPIVAPGRGSVAAPSITPANFAPPAPHVFSRAAQPQFQAPAAAAPPQFQAPAIAAAAQQAAPFGARPVAATYSAPPAQPQVGAPAFGAVPAAQMPPAQMFGAQRAASPPPARFQAPPSAYGGPPAGFGAPSPAPAAFAGQPMTYRSGAPAGYPPAAFGAPAPAPAAFAGAAMPGSRSVFDQMDKNHDGTLSRQEFVEAFVRMQMQGR